MALRLAAALRCHLDESEAEPKLVALHAQLPADPTISKISLTADKEVSKRHHKLCPLPVQNRRRQRGQDHLG